MLAPWQFWTATVIALVVAMIAGYDMMLFSQNRSMQGELARRAQYVQQSVQVEPLYREMVKALADLSVRNQDKALSDLLASQGISVKPPAADSQTAVPSLDANGQAKP